jgi:hypothetical protein
MFGCALALACGDAPSGALEGRGPLLRVRPARLDLGSLEACAVASVRARVVNVGSAPARIVDLAADAPALEPARGIGAVVEPGAELELAWTLRAAAAPSYEGPVAVAYRPVGGGELRTVSFELTAQAPRPGATERFAQTAPQTDFVLVVAPTDTVQAQLLLRDTLRELRATIARTIDYRLALLRLDAPEPSRFFEAAGFRYVNRFTRPGPDAAWRQLIDIRTGGADDDPLFDTLLEALAPERLETDNAGFVREDAFLSVVFVTDGDDASTAEADDVRARLLELKGGDDARFAVTVVSGGERGCASDFIRAAPALRLERVADFADDRLSVCRPTWTELFAEPVVTERPPELELTQTAVPGSVAVRVDGLPVPRDDLEYPWSQRADPSRVVFARPPPPAPVVAVDYVPVPECAD